MTVHWYSNVPALEVSTGHVELWLAMPGAAARAIGFVAAVAVLAAGAAFSSATVLFFAARAFDFEVAVSAETSLTDHL